MASRFFSALLRLRYATDTERFAAFTLRSALIGETMDVLGLARNGDHFDELRIVAARVKPFDGHLAVLAAGKDAELGKAQRAAAGRLRDFIAAIQPRRAEYFPPFLFH